jgi:hypothetical protein
MNKLVSPGRNILQTTFYTRVVSFLIKRNIIGDEQIGFTREKHTSDHILY